MATRASITARAVVANRLRAESDNTLRFSKGGPVASDVDSTESQTEFEKFLADFRNSVLSDTVDETTARNYYDNPDAEYLPYTVTRDLASIRERAKRYSNLRERQQAEREQKGLVRKVAREQDLDSPYAPEGPPSFAEWVPNHIRQLVATITAKHKAIQKKQLV